MPNALSRLLSAANIAFDKQIESRQLVNDSREIKTGDVFCAVIGSASNGNLFISAAIEKGCSVVLSQCQQQEQHGNVREEQGVPVISMYQLDQSLADLALWYYDNPQKKLNIFGVTGTNGKTSVSQLIAQLLEQLGKKAAVIGTTGAGRLNALTPIANTTPGPTELAQLFAQFVEQGITDVAMEVSSHALEQKRVDASLFDIAVFTNLSRDHLDYHGTMENYAAEKFKVFSGQQKQVAILNADDAQAKQWLPVMTQPVCLFSCKQDVSDNRYFVYAKEVSLTRQGMSLSIVTHKGPLTISAQLIGAFNVENLLAAIAVAVMQEYRLTDIEQAVAAITPITGRMETFSAPGETTAVVDYAHTPDALENALSACRQHCAGSLWVVFGCGGDRDKGKRPLMGQVAEKGADNIVVTNDNPRTETPENIASDILAGIENKQRVQVLLDRQRAVLSTLQQAKSDDMVLLAGKGHEDYVIVGEDTIYYNEREVVSNFFSTKKEGMQ
ncbi:UDP-N-acetylmuramoyl-L-alanyl-D-glutamate--2,6-diaminopimelate ligase [Thalassotalea agarivorans]|uniref:UDP-N-acetylmuramoyl-L-alanyl-D-glutamate--2,6-diaminopimelate ligase n=1 Tax=Thalassotalea agarivorans TaxID=349064 RepID=A0A1I0B0M5_THASX|nr:UDP-N-acetylmuramoyl-L-alanyl-D-glutamate--2,6-diaminopimelate ligase [Thalassotalea agarivorans]SET00044.1 UDP-N-acetylmuramoylalanyl-D-glutamate--2,6-diaminopimelate ligase [Thalassotalea agarivorans]